jgi:hypothetical protein
MHTKLSVAAAALVAAVIVAGPAAATPPVTGIGGGVRPANFASPPTAGPASAQQRIAITSPTGNTGVFVLTPLTSGPIVGDSGTATYCCMTQRFVQRDGQSIEIDNPLRTFMGKRGTFVWRAQIAWVDLDNGWSVGTGTWKIVGGTGAYEHLEGHGRLAVIDEGTLGGVGPDAEGLVHLAADSVPPTPARTKLTPNQEAANRAGTLQQQAAALKAAATAKKQRHQGSH